MLVLAAVRQDPIHLFRDGVKLGIVEVEDIRGDKVRLGFELHPDIIVRRNKHVEHVTDEARMAVPGKPECGLNNVARLIAGKYAGQPVNLNVDFYAWPEENRVECSVQVGTHDGAKWRLRHTYASPKLVAAIVEMLKAEA